MIQLKYTLQFIFYLKVKFLKLEKFKFGMSFHVVVAATPSMGIGSKGQLPWKIKEDMEFFKALTTATSDAEKVSF
jgi:hypothetical protein